MTSRDLLLVVQIAICALLVASSLVAVRGLMRSLHGNFGFEPQHAVLVETDLNMAGYRGEAVEAMQKRMIDAMAALPGVAAVGLVDTPPLSGPTGASAVFTEQTTDLRPANAAAEVVTFRVTPEYFRAAGTALLSGRTFSWHDDRNAPRVAGAIWEFVLRSGRSVRKSCRLRWAGHSSCWLSVQSQVCFSDFSPLRCSHSWSTRPLPGIRWSWLSSFWRCVRWVCSPRGFRRSARWRLIR